VGAVQPPEAIDVLVGLDGENAPAAKTAQARPARPNRRLRARAAPSPARARRGAGRVAVEEARV
jgi:hypothetical protein